MPRRPRPAHRAPPAQIRKSNHTAPPLSTKVKTVSKVQLDEPNSKCRKVTFQVEEESSFSEDFKQGSRRWKEDEPGMLDALKRRREEEDEGEDEDSDEDEDEDEEVDTETDIDADADAPRVVQWLDDEDDTWPDELKRKVPDEVRLYFRS